MTATHEESCSPARASRRGLLTGGAAAAAASLLLGREPANAAGADEPVVGARTADVVVIGAGISGLTAARRLAQAGKKVVVLEASDRVGGRTHRLDLGSGLTTEGGGQWIAPSQDRVLALIAELGLTTFKTYNEGRSIYYRKGKRALYTGTIPPTQSITALPAFLQAETQLGAMAATVPAGRPWEALLAQTWDRTTFGDWLDRNVLDAEARWLIGLGYTLVTCQDPHATSLLYMLNFFNTSGGFEEPISVAGGAQDSRVDGGTWLISARMADQMPKGAVVLGSPVSEIRGWGTDRVTVVSKRATITCRQVIVAMSPTEATRIHFTPHLPSRTAGLQRNGGSGTMSKLFMVYDTPFWRQGLNAGAPLNGQVISDLMMTPYVADNSPADGSKGVLVTFMVADSPVPNPYLRWSDDVVNDATLRASRLGEDLATVFGDERFRSGRYAEKLWTNEPWIHGCVNMTAPGVLTTYADALTAPNGNVHWAGSDTSIGNHPSYMEGAVVAGERAADEAVASMR
ncbi:flavin monoamine oxidase family protein [Nocardioides stalactiti]|uniref:flavin monoamine oxidase family protein n=1 Tax=Nocardioides stalactiti TaxID=2755356 RepID=UPI001601FC8D|nr:NAD(P)/FAD-dependent oxidoreductase [Nocardioides stalactiti]